MRSVFQKEKKNRNFLSFLHLNDIFIFYSERNGGGGGYSTPWKFLLNDGPEFTNRLCWQNRTLFPHVVILLQFMYYLPFTFLIYIILVISHSAQGGNAVYQFLVFWLILNSFVKQAITK